MHPEPKSGAGNAHNWTADPPEKWKRSITCESVSSITRKVAGPLPPKSVQRPQGCWASLFLVKWKWWMQAPATALYNYSWLSWVIDKRIKTSSVGEGILMNFSTCIPIPTTKLVKFGKLPLVVFLFVFSNTANIWVLSNHLASLEKMCKFIIIIVLSNHLACHILVM